MIVFLERFIRARIKRFVVCMCVCMYTSCRVYVPCVCALHIMYIANHFAVSIGNDFAPFVPPSIRRTMTFFVLRLKY